MRLELARAVSRADRARLLDPNNVAGQAVSLAEAVASGSAYFVTPRADLMVVDVDLPDEGAGDVLAAFDMLLDAARDARVPFFTTTSGRLGHAHGYFVVAPGDDRVRLERWCREQGLDVRTQGIRPPGAPHRSGVGPGSDCDGPGALEVLRQVPERAHVRALARALCPVQLPGRARLALREGHERAGYASPSHARMALAVGVRARGGSLGLLEALLREDTNVLSRSFTGRPAGWQRAELARLWGKAELWLASHGTPEAQDTDGIVAAVARAPWPGTGGGVRLAVMETLLRRAGELRRLQVGLALGDIALGAGCSLDAARSAVNRLVADGWLRVLVPESASTTRVYGLQVPEGMQVEEQTSLAEAGSVGDLGADAARSAALGKSSVRVMREVHVGGLLSAGEIASRLSMRVAAVRYHLRKLRDAALVRDDADGRWLFVGDAGRLARIAVASGTAGARGLAEAALARARELRAMARRTYAQLRRSRLAGPVPGAPPAVGTA